MNELRSWCAIGVYFARYFWFWWTKRGERPTIFIRNRHEDALTVLSPILGFRHIDVINPENCPRSGPAIFCGNHLKLDDPFFAFRAVHLATGGEFQPHLMSRDDFFAGTPLKTRFFDGDDLMRSFGTHLISRSRITLSQLKPFLRLLKEDGGFVMYPGYSRSCSGVFMEYRGAIKEPGGVSFFVASAQRSRPDVRVAAVPVIRSYNPVSKRSAVVFGRALYLDTNADRAAQRAFDCDLVWEMSQYLEVNVPQALSAILYLRCLHGRPNPVSVAELRETASQFFQGCTHPYIDPEAKRDIGGAVLRTLDYHQKRGMLHREHDQVTLDREAILSVPDLTPKYRHLNSVKYLLNQILHLQDVTARLHEVAL